MKLEEILKLRDVAEHTCVQFKERVTKDNKSEVAAEMVAMSNTRGGKIIVGIDDKTGHMNPLSYAETQDTTELLGNLATQNVIPSVLLDIMTVPSEGGALVVAIIKQGLNKPYHDNNGVVWVKQGADKRKVFDNSELIAMLADNGQIHPDALPVRGTTIKDLNMDVVKDYLIKRFEPVLRLQDRSAGELHKMSAEEVAKAIGVEQTVENILKNIGLILPDGTLTVAAVVLMGEYPQRWLPVFTARCISFIGNSIGGSEFRDKSGSDADGNAVHLYKYIMTFLMRNLRRKQVEADFNSPGELEVSSPRNKLLFSNGIHLLPYTGAGSGLTRAQLYTPDIKFENDERLREFVVTIWRESVRVSVIDDVRVGEVKKLNNSEISNDTSLLDLSSDTVNSVRAERIPYKLLGGVMKNIIQFCSIPRAGREILEHIGYSYHTKNLAKFITPLLDMNYLEPTIPDKPKSPHQRYRKKQK